MANERGLIWQSRSQLFVTYLRSGLVLYFRVGEINEKDYQPYGSEPFVYDGKNRPIVMSYLTLPDKVLHDVKLLPKWIEKARDASLCSRSKRK